MSEHDPESPGREARDARVRLLLGRAAGAEPGPMPADVHDRLQAVVAGLAAEQVEGAVPPTAGTDASTTVPHAPVDLAARRRARLAGPRRRGTLAAAAAAVVLVGAAGVAAATHQLTAGRSADARAGGGSSSSQRTLPTTVPGSPAATASTDPGTTPGTATAASPGTGSAAAALPAVSRSSFARDVTTLLRQGAPDPAPATEPGSTPGSTGSTAGSPSGARRAPTPTTITPPTPATSSGPGTAAYAGCTPPRTTPGTDLRAIRLDGQPAVLVLGPVRGGERTATAWSCTGRTPLLSARVRTTG